METVLGRTCDEDGITGGRQYRDNTRQLETLLGKRQKQPYPNAKDEAKRRQINAAYADYPGKVEATIETLTQPGHVDTITALQDTIRHAVRQGDPIERRVLKGDVIPHLVPDTNSRRIWTPPILQQ